MSQAPATEIRNEIATTRDGRDITRPFLDPLMPLPQEDTVLLERGGGDYRLYNEVLRDDHVKSAVEQRRRAVIARPWEVRPGGKRAIDKAAADFLKENIDALGWDIVCEKMLMGIFHGFSVAEAMWQPDGRYWRLGELRVRNRRRFGFNNSDRLVLKTMARPLGEPMPDRKFWVFATGADHDDAPYGLGLAHWLYWPVWFKRNAHRFWAVFLEKFGTPAVKGTYPPGTPEAQQLELLESLRGLRQDSAVVVPEGMAVDLIEATRAGTADFAGFVDAMNKAILVATIGQTASTQGRPGALGAEKEQDKVRLDIVKADADLLSASFNNGVARWLTEWNFPGAAVPGVWRLIEESEDLKARSDRDKNIYTMGYKPTLKYIEETYGGEWEDKPEPVKPDQTGLKRTKQGDGSADFANPYHDELGRFTTADGAVYVSTWGQRQAQRDFKPTIRDGHHTLARTMTIERETEKAVGVRNLAMMEARATARYDVKELSTSQIEMLRSGQGNLTWLPKSQISTHDGEVVGMAPWLADKQGYTTVEREAARAKAFDAGKTRYNELLAKAKAAGVKGVRVGMRTKTIKEKMAAAGVPVEFSEDDDGLDWMSGVVEFANPYHDELGRFTTPDGVSYRVEDLFKNGSRVQYFDDKKGLFFESQQYPRRIGWRAGEVVDGQTNWLSDKEFGSMDEARAAVRGLRTSNALKAMFQKKYGKIPATWSGEQRKAAKAIIDAGVKIDRYSSSTQSKSRYLFTENGVKVRLADHELPGTYDAPDIDHRYGGDVKALAAKVSAAEKAAGSTNHAFAEGGAQEDPVALMAARMARDTGRSVNDWLATIRTMLDKAGDLEEFRAMLDAAFAELPGGQVANAMADGFMAAGLAGMAEAKNGL